MFGKLAWGALGLLAMLAVALWIGKRTRPKPFAPYPERTPPLDTIELPANLPVPVERFYRVIAGNRIPVLESAVLTGRGDLRLNGLELPARFRFTHNAGQDYRHYIEVALFGQPLLKVNERYLDGHATMELPTGVVENEPKVDMAANLGLWGESIWLPAIFVTDSRVRWEAIDDTHARLVVPFGDHEDTFIVEFDAHTGLLRTMDAMRYRDATDEAKIPWKLEAIEWQDFHGILVPVRSSVTWQDQGKPWLVITLDDVVYNVDVSAYLRERGL